MLGKFVLDVCGHKSMGVWFVLCLWMMYSLFYACVRIDFVDAVTMRRVLKCAFVLSHSV